MKIIITGITGLFGSYLARAFMDQGEVHGIKRSDSDLSLVQDIHDQIIWHEGDINDYPSLEMAFQGIDLIIHAAGLVSFQSSDEKKLLKINVEGTANVVNVMLDKGIKNLIHISSVSALGRTSENLNIDEDHKWSMSPLNTSYAISKYLGELEVWRGAQEGLDVMVVNPSVLLGKLADKRSTTASSTAVYDYVIKENKFFPKGNINYIDIRDAATITLELFKLGKWNERFILNKESISYQQFFLAIANHTGNNAPKWAVSDRYIGVVNIYFKIKGIFSNSLFNKKAAMAAQLPIIFDNTKTSNLLDFSYRSLDDTLSWAMGNEN